MSDLIDLIRSKGYWRIDIRPTDYRPDRVPYASLKSIVERNAVRLRGWDFPHIGRQDEFRRGNDWFGGETEWTLHRESWRFYRSGQFVHLAAIQEDWVDPDATFSYLRFRPGDRVLGVGDALFTISEAYEFASRISVTEAGGDRMRVEIELHNVSGRYLYVDNPRRMPMDNPYVFHEDPLRSVVEAGRDELAGRSRDLALDVATEMFARFGWHPPREMLKGQQDELRWGVSSG